MAKKRKWVPEVLWRLFRGRVRTLAETIMALIPEKCSCRNKTKSKCLHCCFHRGSEENPVSFLPRPDDPPDYQILLNRSFVVIHHNAPPLSPDAPSGRRWSQLKIVKRTIETILVEQPGSSNLITCGYDKFKDLGSNAKLLNTSAWDLALHRVGDGIMSYILMHTSIFLPVPHGKHQQVTGPPVSSLINEFQKHTTEPEILNVPAQKGASRKRRRGKGDSSGHEESLCALPSQVKGSKKITLKQYNYKSVSGRKNHLRQFERRDRQAMPSSRLDLAIIDIALTVSGDKLKDEGSRTTDAKPNQCKRARCPRWLRKRNKSLSSNDARVQGSLIEGTQLDKPDIHGNNLPNWAHTSGDSDGNDDKLKASVLQENLPLCSCCSVFESSPKVPKGAMINRQSMLYNLESSSSIFPKRHMLNSLKLGFGGTARLMKKIFGLSNVNSTAQLRTCSHSEGFQHRRSTCLYHSLMRLLKVLICRAQRCKYEALLDRHCPVPCLFQNQDVDTTSCGSSMTLPAKRHASDLLEASTQNKRLKTSKIGSCSSKMDFNDPQSFLSKCYSSKHQVVSFIWAACRNIVPLDLLGAPANWRILRKNIGKLIQLRRFEKSTLQQCIYKLKVSEFPALSIRQCSYHWNSKLLPCGSRGGADGTSTIKQKLFERWFLWFFSDLVVPIVQANFYVTESEHGKQELYFYRKSVWKKLSDQAVVSLKQQSYSTLDDESIRNILYNRPFGFSKLRFRPKEIGVRAIANLRASSKIYRRGSGAVDQYSRLQKKARPYTGGVGYLKSVNNVLRDIHSMLRDLRIKKPDYWGASVFDYNDVYRKFYTLMMNVKRGAQAMPTIFIVVSDVKKAFDTVNQNKLLKIVDEVLLKDEYVMQKSHEIVCRKRSMWSHENLRLADEQCAELKTAVASRPWNTIVVDQEQIRSIRKEEIYFYLHEHVKHNILQLGQRFLLQDVGIPQGSILSSLLCSLYYGHLERNVILPFLKKECVVDSTVQTDVAPYGTQSVAFGSAAYTLLRFTDDFLFMSTSRYQASSLFSRLQRGFQEYNCYMNKDKFCLNFDTDQIPMHTAKRIVVGDDGISFIRWSGLLINCCTLEVLGDYTRYLKNHLRSTLTICWQGRPGRQLKAKLRDYMRPKCHPIFYDSNINSSAVVKLNVYQAFLLCAMKFHCYVRELSSVCKLLPRAYFQAIQGSLSYMHKLIKKRMRSVALFSNCKPILQLTKEETMRLGLTAYTRVLNRKQSRYKELLRLLRSELAALSDIGGCSSSLMYALDDSHSSLIWKVKF